MSRETSTTTTGAVTGQLTTASRHIFVTPIKQSDGTTKLVMSAQSLGDKSTRVNVPSNIGAITLLKQLYMRGDLHIRGGLPLMNYNVLEEIFAWVLGVSVVDGSVQLIGNYSRALKGTLSVFSNVTMDPFIIVDAAMRGQEDMVMNILNADPSYLLKKAKVKNSVGVEYNVTPLQAAIMANDIQMVEKMREHFARLTTDLAGNPIDGFVEMHNQIKAIYSQSLNRYVDIQKTVLKEQETNLLQLLQLPTDLNAAQKKQYKEIEEKIKQTTKRIVTYKDALRPECNDIHKIIEAHNQAQEHNAFDFQPYVDAILNATPAELDDAISLVGAGFTETVDARKKPFAELTLVEKLNRFREELKAHMQKEIIFNPNHILAGLKDNEKIWDEVDANRVADADYKKRIVIFSQLVGWAQRNAAEPVKQDIRQGTWYLTQENERRARPSRFNDCDVRNSKIIRNSLLDVTLVDSSLVDGLGYKFGAGARGRGAARAVVAAGVAGARSRVSVPALFITYVEQKHRAWKTYYAREITPVSQSPGLCNDVR